jgi:hypothetical protein
MLCTHVQDRQRWKMERQAMQQEVESLSNLVGLLLWQREELEGRDPEAADLHSLAEFHGLTSRPPSSAGCLTPSAASAAGTPRSGFNHSRATFVGAGIPPLTGGGTCCPRLEVEPAACLSTGRAGLQAASTGAVDVAGLGVRPMSARGPRRKEESVAEERLPRSLSELSGAGLDFHKLLDTVTPVRMEAGHA